MRILLLFSAFIFIISCSPNKEGSAKNGTTYYQVDLKVDVQNQKISVHTTLTHNLRDSEQDSIAFLVHGNMAFSLINSEDYESVKEVDIDGSKLKRIVLKGYRSSRKNDDKTDISFEYEGVLKEVDMPWGIDKISSDWIEISSNSMWLPIIETFDVYATVQAEVILDSSEKMVLISSGSVIERASNIFEVINTIEQIDFVLLAAPKLNKISNEKIDLFTKDNPDQFYIEFLERSEQSLDWLNKHFGETKTLEKGKLVVAPRTESGYARKNFIILTDIKNETEEFLTEFITHEFAHFWSSKTNPRTRHRWLDESIAEYVALVYVREVYGLGKYDSIIEKFREEAPSLPPVYDESREGAPPHAVMYRKGVVKLDWLEKRVGWEVMVLILNKWFSSASRDTKGFLFAIEEVTNIETVKSFELEIKK